MLGTFVIYFQQLLGNRVTAAGAGVAVRLLHCLKAHACTCKLKMALYAAPLHTVTIVWNSSVRTVKRYKQASILSGSESAAAGQHSALSHIRKAATLE